MDATLRTATPSDAAAIAALHADSWRRHYRGAYSDAFLDGPVLDERLAVWTQRLTPAGSTATVVLDDGGDLLAGFVHVVLDAEPAFGPLVDNLHVRHDLQGGGFGRALMRAAAEVALVGRPGAPLHLWVLEQNVRAQGFYDRIGGEQQDRRTSTPPGGGRVTAIRVVWADPAMLLGV